MEKPRWKVVRIEQIAARKKHALAMGPFGSRITKDNFVDFGVPVIRGRNLSNGRFDHSNLVFLTEEKADELTASSTVADDLVFTHRGTLGQVGIIPKGYYPRYIVSQSQMKLTCDQKKVFPMFLYYYFRSDLGQHALLSHTGGAGVPAISSPLTTLKNVSLPLPPLPVQRQIANILSAYDDLIENNTHRIAILEEKARILYQEWFVEFRFPGHEQVKMVESKLGRVPEGWAIKPFSDLVHVLGGGTPKTSVSEYWYGDIPFFTPKDSPDSFYVLSTEKYITKAGLHACSSKLYPKGTIFITARGTVGKLALNSVDMAMNQSCYALIGKDSISQIFLFLHTEHFLAYLKQVANGAIFETLIVDTFTSVQVIKPPSPIIDQFSSIVEPIFGQLLKLLQKNDNLRRTRDLLLPKLISGEIDVSSWVDDEEQEQEFVVSETEGAREMEPAQSIDVAAAQQRMLWE